jgi:chromosome segregation ATPase
MDAHTRQPLLDVTTASLEEMRAEVWRLRREIEPLKEERRALAAASREVNAQLPQTIADLLELALDSGGFETADERIDDVASEVSQRADACKRRNKPRARILQDLHDRLNAGSPESEAA